MQVKVNDTTFDFPTNLNEISLGSRIEFHNQFGKKLDEDYIKLTELEEGTLKDLELTMYNVDAACKTFSFFSKIDLKVIQETENLESILQVYSAIKNMFSESITIQDTTTFEWENEIWEIQPPELKSTSNLTFGEFVDSKQILHVMHELGNSNWEMLQCLCAIYLRKKGEVYDKSFSDDDSDRMKLMYKLPLDIALQVGFFLRNSMSLFQKTLAFFQVREQREVEI